MKKTITIVVIVLIVLGLGIFLFKISPQQEEQKTAQTEDFNLAGVGTENQPLAPVSDDHILGNPQAKNTMVAFEDIQCPACANFEPTIKAIPTELKDTKLIFRHFPLLTLHPNAANAAFAAEAASAQGKFWEFTTLLYQNQNKWADLSDPSSQFAAFAQQAGVSNIDQFKADISSKKYKSRVERDLREGTALNVNGTPTIYFNGQKLQLSDIAGIKSQVEKLYK